MVDKARAAASVIGVLTGLVAVYHGYNETLQGGAAPGSIFINAVGPPCQGSNCFPAMTILPSFLLAGVVTIAIALLVIVWAAAFVKRRNGAIVLIALSVALLLVGGGYLSPVLGLAAGLVGTRIKRT